MTFPNHNRIPYCSQNFLLFYNTLHRGTSQFYGGENFPLTHHSLRPQRAESGSRCGLYPQKDLISTKKGALELLELLNRE